MFLLSRPATRQIDAFLATLPGQRLSYDPQSVDGRSSRWTVDEHTIVLGRGVDAFRRASAAVLAWKPFDIGWIEIFPPNAPVQPGTVVAVVVRHFGFWSMNGCRVTDMTRDSDRVCAFTYATFQDHAECGDERFAVTMEPESQDVTYTIRAVSKPCAPLARLGYPLTRMLQARFRRDSGLAMQRAVSQD